MKILLALCMLFALTPGGTAQDATATPAEPIEPSEMTPFLRALSLIPNTSGVRGAEPMFSYADYHAAIEARGMDVPESLAGYLAEGEPDGPLFPALPQAGPSGIMRYLGNGGPDYPITVGFDFFQIAQAVEFGVPPVTGQILIGDFNEEAIRTVYALRSYTTAREDELGTLLCPAAGCSEGMQQNIRERNPANPFGGDLGRSEAIFVGENVLLNSSSDVVVESMAAAYADSASSLAEMPEFQALANVLAEYPYVSAVMAAKPFALASLDPRTMTENPEVAERLLADLEAAPLPPYLVTAFASAADTEHEYGLTLLVFASADAAQDAAAVIDNRLATMESFRTQQVFTDLLNEAGTLEPAQVITDEVTGLSVVVVRVAGDLPTSEPVDGSIVRSHLPYQRFVQMMYTRDTNWLVWGGGEE